MRIFIATLMAALLMVTGCGVTLVGGGHGGGHYRHSSHRHNRHHGHRHWNAAGPAYSEASKLKELAAKLVAAQLTERTDSIVTGTFSRTQPKTGYFMKLEITYIDVGDARPNEDGSARLRGSALAAHGVIVNAETNSMVADVKFTESSGWSGDIRFETFMASIGSSLGDWFKAKRKQ
jgi:hypothetical protein